MTIRDPEEPRMTPAEGAESEERELAERMGAERQAGPVARRDDDDDDPREEEGWSQPESSAQKGPSAPEQPGPERT